MNVKVCMSYIRKNYAIKIVTGLTGSINDSHRNIIKVLNNQTNIRLIFPPFAGFYSLFYD